MLLCSRAGVVFVGGFSYADVLDSAKGWAGTSLRQQFQAFYSRPDTFSLGICNGCQLMALLGWVPGTGQQQDGVLLDAVQPRFIHNRSGRCAVQQMPAMSCRALTHLFDDMPVSDSQLAAADILERRQDQMLL